MAKYDSDDRDLYPGSGVLINLLGITDQTDLDDAEATIILSATLRIGKSPLPEPREGPGFSYLLAIHRALFGDIYAWAGTVRSVDISKGGNRFANWRFIDHEGARLSADLAREHWLSSPTLRADSGFGNSSDSKTAWQNRSEPSSTLMPM